MDEQGSLARIRMGQRQIALTQDQRRSFDEAGYLILDDPCEPELLDSVREEAEPLLQDRSHPGPNNLVDGVYWSMHPGSVTAGYYWQRVRNAWKVGDAIRSLALAPRVLGAVEELHDRPVLPFQTLNFPVGTQQPAHADSFAFQSDPPGYMCGVWVALEDMDMDNGTLVYYPGSNKLPMPTWELIQEEMNERPQPEDFQDRPAFLGERQRLYMEYCQELITRHRLKPEYATIRKGQAMIWSANLLHGGSPQRDPARTRHSQVTHYFFEGCRVYTPLRSEGDHIYWEYPEWIRDPVPEYSVETLAEVIREHVPEGAGGLVATGGYFDPAALEGVNGRHFPQGPDGAPVKLDDEQALAELERQREEGARFIVFPKEQLWSLEYEFPRLQDALEKRYRAALRDGSFGAIYLLD